jgi:hypothetical protein
MDGGCWTLSPTRLGSTIARIRNHRGLPVVWATGLLGRLHRLVRVLARRAAR